MMPANSSAGGVSLRQALPEAQFWGGADVFISSCATDWRKCRPGDLYVALIDEEDDGHEHAQRAIDLGARAVLAERALPLSAPVCIVRDTRAAYSRLCQTLAGHPARRMHLAGVTGSNGKTVVTLLLASALEAAGKRIGVVSTLGCCDGVEAALSPSTTPPPAELARWLTQMANRGCEYAIVEMSSRALARHEAAGLEFDTAVLTNIRGDHIDEHGSMRACVAIKRRLLERLKSEGVAVFNADDAASRKLLERHQGPALTVSVDGAGEITATVVERHLSEQTFLLTAGAETVAIRTRMIGDHHVENCLQAVAAGLAMGIDLPTLVQGIEAVERVPGRLERIECGQPFGVFVDYARTPDSLASALRALRSATTGRVLCVYGAPGEEEREKRPRLGRVVEKLAHWGVITSDNPRSESPRAIAHDILDGYERPIRAHVLPNRAEAIKLALNSARPGDAVLIAGKGNETLQEIDGRVHEHDDREVARGWLRAAAAEPPARETPASAHSLPMFRRARMG